MLDIPKRDRRAERRDATKAEIIEAAWELCRAEGLAALSLRDLAARVGMQAPSLYSYFSSKHDIYDAMFAQAMQETAAAQPDVSDEADLRTGLLRLARWFVHNCTEDPVRYQLLFQRTIPRFEPSPEAYAISVHGFNRVLDFFARHGLTDPRCIDMYTAVLTGLVDQQTSNDPGGDRWTRLVDDAVEMFLAFAETTKKPRKERRPRR